MHIKHTIHTKHTMHRIHTLHTLHTIHTIHTMHTIHGVGCTPRYHPLQISRTNTMNYVLSQVIIITHHSVGNWLKLSFCVCKLDHTNLIKSAPFCLYDYRASNICSVCKRHREGGVRVVFASSKAKAVSIRSEGSTSPWPTCYKILPLLL